MKSIAALSGLMLFAAGAQAAPVIPPNCTLEDWCLKTSTRCFVGRVAERGGFYQGYAQYSVVRKAVALCPTYPYGHLERIQILTPVEPVEFVGDLENTSRRAGDAALGLCQRYRADWVEAAPKCPGYLEPQANPGE